MRMMKNEKEKIILTDVDGVCLDWEFGFHTWMSVHGHELVDKDNYSVAIQYNMELPKAKSLIRTFNESAAVGFLPPLRDAQYYIKNNLGMTFVKAKNTSPRTMKKINWDIECKILEATCDAQ